MLDFFDFKSWEIWSILIVSLFLWGLLRERALRKIRRHTRGENTKLMKSIIIRASQAGQLSNNRINHRDNTMSLPYQPAGIYDHTPILPLSNEPSDPNERYIVAAMGMENNRQDFYKQAWEASRNNEYTMMSYN